MELCFDRKQYESKDIDHVDDVTASIRSIPESIELDRAYGEYFLFANHLLRVYLPSHQHEIESLYRANIGDCVKSFTTGDDGCELVHQVNT